MGKTATKRQRPARGVRSIVLGLLLVLGGTSVGLIASEAMLRVFRLAPSGGVHSVTSDEFERIPGILAAGQRLVDRSVSSLPYSVRINALGYRGDDFPPTRPAGETRILMVGDSFTFGYLVDEDETLPVQLQRALAAGCRNPIRVVNAGLVGSSVISARQMALRGLAVDPDLVVLTFSENDVQDLAGTEAWEQLARNRAAKSRLPLRWLYPIARDSALWNLGLRVRARFALWQREAVLDREGHGPNDAAVPDEDPKILRDRYIEEFGALRRDLAERGLPFVFVLFPSHHRLDGRDADRVAWAESVGRDAGVPVVNLLPRLAESGLSPQQLYLLPIDGHPSAAAYSIAAAELADRIRPVLPAGVSCGAAGTAVAPPRG